nr:MAG TPA: hypothetical protein [Caudoviricetes sp.]
MHQTQLFLRLEVCPLSHNCITQWTTWLVVEAEKNPVNLKLEKRSLYFLFIQINVTHNW